MEHETWQAELSDQRQRVRFLLVVGVTVLVLLGIGYLIWEVE